MGITNHALVTAGRGVLLLGSAALIALACGEEPKKDPVTPVAMPSSTPATTAPAPAEAGAPTTAAADAGGGGAASKEKECDALQDEANSILDAERIAVDKLCKKDADCMPIKGRACHFNCVNAAIPKVEEKDWNESLTKVKDGACKKWTDNECAKLRTKPLPTCQDKKVWCDKGHCALK